MDTLLDWLRSFVIFIAGFIAIGGLGLAVFEAYHQRIPSAVFLGTLGVICTFMLFMPRLEVLKAWGVEARLTRLDKTLDRAEEILGRVRKLASISARATYLTMAWGNRMGTPKAEDKQDILDGINAQLADLKVTPEERASIVQPWVRMIRLDFFYLFTRVLREFSTLKASGMTARVHRDQNQEAHDASKAYSDLITPWSRRTNDFGAMDKLDTKSLSSVIDEYLPEKGDWLSDKELAVIDGFKQEIVRLEADCEKKGGYTTEAAAFYDCYSESHADKAKELWDKSR